MDAFSTSSITEFAIVLAGFSGLVIAIGSKDGKSSPLTKHRTLCMLSFSFAAAFGSLLPTLALSFGISNIWAFSSYGLIFIVVIAIIVVHLSTRLLLNKEERKKLAWYMYILIYWINAFLVFLMALAPTAGHFYIALVWQLIVSAILFTRLILQS
tara:strand:- start:789 stop:1253 length:465 start_codon:yes stop_codon:yes gene_type:complete